MADLDQPLDAEDIAGIKQALKDIDKAAGVLAKARAAGVDVTAQESQLREVKDKLTRIKQQFAPGR